MPESILVTQKRVPAAADNLSFTCGASWANPAYQELIASTSNAIAILGIVCNRPGFGMGSCHVEVDIATGAAASESVVATFRWGASSTSVGGNTGVVMLPVPYDNIGSGIRVAVRVRKGDAGNDDISVSLIYADSPLTGVTTTTNNPKVEPSAANGIVVTPNGSAWVNSAYVQVIASTASAQVLDALCIQGSGNTGEAYLGTEYEIATGGAGAETVIATHRMGRLDGLQGGRAGYLPFMPSLQSIGNAVRVAFRVRQSGTNVGTHALGYTYH